MLNYLRESLHWIHLVFFKPFTFEAEAMKLTRSQSLITLLKITPITLIIYSFFLAAVGVACSLAGYPFNWNIVFLSLIIGQILWPLGSLFLVMMDKAIDKVFSSVKLPPSPLLRGGIYSGMYMIAAIGLIKGSNGLVSGVVSGLAFGLMGWLFGSTINAIAIAIISGVVQGVIAQFDKGFVEVINFALATALGFFFTYFRPFYLFPYILQYWRAGSSHNPFDLFHHSPIYWDEVIAIPLPRLKNWLVDLVIRDRKRGLEEILFVAEKRPYQRKAAFNALLAVAEQDLKQINDIKGLVKVASILKAFPDEEKESLKGLSEAQRRSNRISTLAQDYQTRLTLDGQLKVLEDLRDEVEYFRSAMALTTAPVGTTFQPLAARWLSLIKDAEVEARDRMQFSALPNPYVFGNPLQPRDEQLFVGRRDILRALENYILNTNQRPSLLLYGQRRTGKSSTLLNLPRSQFEPVYIDCQDAKWHESDQAFCYNLAHEIYAALQQSEDVKGISPPQLEQFAQNAFTRLDQYLDRFEKLSQQRGKRILLSFDEYEGLQESITHADISKNVLGKLRNIIQHRERIVVLVSGSHRFEELPGLNWASYLINMRTLELSFLDEASARELLTEPVPKLQYEDGVVDEILRLTHCQPYLLQAVASELVNHLNEEQKTVATMADLDAAVEKVLVSAGSYFANTWREDRSEEERTVLLTLALQESVPWAEYPTALRNLLNSEILERSGDGYQFTVELFRRWILKHHAPVLQYGERESLV